MDICVLEFIPCMDKLFDESILIGSGYTARETLRYGVKCAVSTDKVQGGSEPWHFVLRVFQQT